MTKLHTLSVYKHVYPVFLREGTVPGEAGAVERSNIFYEMGLFGIICTELMDMHSQLCTAGVFGENQMDFWPLRPFITFCSSEINLQLQPAG